MSRDPRRAAREAMVLFERALEAEAADADRAEWIAGATLPTGIRLLALDLLALDRVAAEHLVPPGEPR